MMAATMTLAGLMAYDSTLFDSMQFPDGLDREMVINTILMETAPFEALVPEPTLCKSWLGLFSQRRIGVWRKLYATTMLEYNVLDDTDLVIAREGTDNDTRTPDLTHTRTPNLTTTGQNSGSDTVEQRVAAFNSGDYAPRERQETSLGTSNTVHSTGTETTQETGTETTERTRKSTDTTSGRRTPAADLLTKEREAALFDVVHYIAQDVKANFCIMVY